ncbi:MAG: type II secretion system protein [Magnetococcales bacterium]|nr:type II secretion system protein [Magnetococcales bacterium]
MHALFSICSNTHSSSSALQTDRYQGGFSLIEIATVMVIIGLLVGGGLMMGRSLIQGAKVKDLIAIKKDLSGAARLFKQRYKFWPGDLPNAGDDISGVSTECDYAPAAQANIGNGRIDNVVITGTVTESSCVADHLVQAGMIRGGGDDLASRFGAMRVLRRAASSVTTIPDSVEHVVEMDNLPLEVAQELDRILDDDDITTGFARGSSSADPVPFYAVPL